MLSKYFRRGKVKIFFHIYPRKQAYVMQIVSQMSKPISWKTKENYYQFISAELALRVVKVKSSQYCHLRLMKHTQITIWNISSHNSINN